MTDVPLSDPSEPAFIFAEQTIAASTALLCLLLMMFLSFIGKSYASLSLSASSIDELKSFKKTNREAALRLLSCPHDIVRAMALWRNLLLAVFAVAVLHLFHASTLTSNTFTDELCFVAASALLLFVFGYWIPWKMARRASLPFVCRIAPLTAALLRAASPFLARIISEEEVQNYVEENNTLTAESVGDALKITEQQQDTEEADMLKSVLRFGEESVSEVMRPRIDIADVDIHASYDEVKRLAIKSTFSRLPVTDATTDKVCGLLYVRDLLPHMNEAPDYEWQKLIRSAYFVPESKMIDDLLREFQKNKVHIAIVVDEYGGTSGLITMEDILEEIVGEINDEYDKEEHNFVQLDPDTYIFEGKTPLSDFYETLRLNEADFEEIAEESETLAGLVLELLNEFPQPHQKTAYRNLQFEVLRVNERRITRIKVTRTTPPAPSEKKK